MVDRAVLAARVASVRDAVGRMRSVLPADTPTFIADRTSREVVILNLFVAHQYAVIDWERIHEIASRHLDDLLLFCEELVRRAGP